MNFPALSWTDGMLYPVPQCLERQGYVKSISGKSEIGRRRKHDQLTDRGAQELTRQQRQWEVVNQALRQTSLHCSELIPSP
jgi:DNA-binding PadR family transcriptional regulator